jgi:SAM-dependent methyltransferase
MLAVDTSEIQDEDIDVEEILRKIKENIKIRTESEKEDDLLMHADGIRRDLDYINSNWDIQNNSYSIRSNRPIIGKMLVKGRELVHGEVRRYVDPMIWMQKEFNISIVKILKETERTISEISQKMIELDNTTIIRMKSEFNGLNFFIFEDRFRGSREEIKKQQSNFVNYFEGCKNVLEIGCGRGEFLELLRENGIMGHGVDVDGDMVDFCASKGLNSEKIDALSYLEKIDDNSLDGIFLDQVVEHLDPEYIIKMLRLCHKKLNYGYYILIETVNPLSLVSLANFYLDLSHKKPIHPETLKFLMVSVNFNEIETKFFSPVADEARLRKINADVADESNRKLIEVYNYNIDMLNNILYGSQDYVVIGKK